MPAQERIRLRQILTEAEGYLELGMPQHALDALARLGDTDHFNSRAFYLQGQSLRELARYEEAIGPLRQAARIAPGNIDVWLTLGWCYKRTGRIHRAIEAMEEAIAAEPNEAITHYNMACYLSIAGEKEDAVRQLAEALILSPHYRELVDAEPDFNPIRSDRQFQMLTSIIV